MFAALGHFAYRRRILLLVASALFLVLSGLFGAGLFPKLSNGGYSNPAAESARVADLMRDEFAGTSSSLIVLMRSRSGATVDTPEVQASAKQVVELVRQQPWVKAVQSAMETGAPMLVSQGKKSTFAVVEIVDDGKSAEHVRALRKALHGGTPALEVLVGGAPAVDADVLDQVARDLKLAEAITLPVTAVLLLFVFGSVVAASLPLAMGGLSILGAFLLLRILVHFTPVSVFAVNVVSMLGMGLAIDYSLFVVSRFREELALGKSVEAALVRTMQTAGHTVLFSGVTVTLSLLSLLLFPQMLLRSMGVGGSAGVIVAMVMTLTGLPAALAVLGPRINALAVGKRAKPHVAEHEGFWYRLSQFVMRHPVVVLVATLVPLLIAGSPFLHVRFSMPDERNLPKGLESRVAAERLRAEFGGEELSPINVLVRMTTDPTASEGVGELYEWVQKVKALPGVKRVDSLVSLDPRLDRRGRGGYASFYRMVKMGMMDEGKSAIEHFSHGNDTLVQVHFAGDPHGMPARELVNRLRALGPPQGATVLVGGSTAELVDLLRDMSRAVPRAIGVIVGTIFVLLFLMLGSLVVPLKAVILNFLSLTVSFGALVWVFQDGHLAWLLGVEPIGSIDALQPMLVFVIAFGLSMDYEVFLLSRIQESYQQCGDNTRAVALGIQRTGGIITSAALLLSVVILGFATGKVQSLKQVGMGLLLAVLVDATLIRSLLVPATMRLLGGYNWWAPAPLRWVYQRLGLGALEAEEPHSERSRAA